MSVFEWNNSKDWNGVTDMKIIFAGLLAVALYGQNPNTSAFPTTVATDTNLAVAKRLSQSTLSGSINSSVTSLNVADGTQFLTSEIIRIDSEEMQVTGIATNTLTITRAFNGTTAASHTTGATVSGIVTSHHHNQLAAEVKTIEDRLKETTSGCQDAGSNDTYACNLAPAIASYTTGSIYRLKVNTDNTGAATANFNSVGAKTIKKRTSSGLTDLATGDVKAGDWLVLVYDGTYLQLVGAVSGGGGDVTTSGTNAMTGYTNFSGGTLRLPETVTASLPAASGATGLMYVVTDASSSNQCASGGGTLKTICRSDGSNWLAVTPYMGGGTGISYSCSGITCTVSFNPGDGQPLSYCNSSSSSGTVYACATPTPSAYASLATGNILQWNVGGTACTGSTTTTVNVNSIGAKKLFRYDGTSNPLSTECPANRKLLMMYDAALDSSAGAWRIIGGTPPDSSSTTFTLGLVVTKTSATIANLSTGKRRYNSTFPELLNACVVTLTSGSSGNILFYLKTGSSFNYALASGLTATQSGDCVSDGTQSSFPTGTLALGYCTVSSSLNISSCTSYDVVGWDQISGTNGLVCSGNACQVDDATRPSFGSSTTVPGSCSNVGQLYFDTDAATGGKFYYCNGSTYEGVGASSGASTALDNLSSVNINSALLAQTGIDLGSTTKPFRDLYLFGGGTYGTNYFKFTGTPTSTRTLTLQDATGNVPVIAGSLSVASGKTFTSSNTWTATATDSSSVAFGAGGTVSYTIASGTSALGTSAISSGACATVVTTTATGTATTDVIQWVFNADPTSTTGYAASANGGLHIIAYPTSNNVNFKVCNDTASSITPGATVTLNWRVAR